MLWIAGSVDTSAEEKRVLENKWEPFEVLLSLSDRKVTASDVQGDTIQSCHHDGTLKILTTLFFKYQANNNEI